MKHSILSHLPQDHPWATHLHCYPTIDSTNTQAKAMAAQGAPQGTVVIARQQTAGRGRMGRSFHSPQSQGVYLSVILRPQCRAEALMHLTCAAAVAMCDAVEAASGLRPGIKWINDLVVGRQKLGGILTELALKADGTVDYAVVGIGINCTQAREDFPLELRDLATSLAMATGSPADPHALAAQMILALEDMADTLLTQRDPVMARYQAHCVTLGKEVAVHSPKGVRHGRALRVDSSGALVVAYPDGTQEAVNAGEVSIRGMYGYLP